MTSLVKKRENNCRGSVEMGTAGPVGLLKDFTVTGQGWSVHSVVRMFMVLCVIMLYYMQYLCTWCWMCLKDSIKRVK